MFDLIRENQLNIMLSLSSVCMAFGFFVLLTKTLTRTRKVRLFLLQVSSALLLFFDRLAYIYSGDPSDVGYVMVRLTNFFVFSLTLAVILSLNLYLTDLFKNEGGLEHIPFRFTLVDWLCVIGIALVVISQFTGWYYTFDDHNAYNRGPLFLLCYIFPSVASLVQLTVVWQYRKRVSRGVCFSIMFIIVVPVIASLIQIKTYGLSLTNMTIVGAAMLAFVFSFLDVNKRAELAKKTELQYHQDEHRSMQRLFEETSSAIVNALDAKDPYTEGHSERVAKYAKLIAEKCGKSPKECEEIYYGALLHDIGKISIPDRILESDGSLSAEDYEIWKSKSLRGDEILSKIKEYPYLRDSAHYVHERYDGSGYPDHLKGEEIPDYVRVISVADYYDSMMSDKRYRSSYPLPFIREVFIKGAGTKFDPKYAEAMVSIIDDGVNNKKAEKTASVRRAPEHVLKCGAYRSELSRGIQVEHTILDISFKCVNDENSPTGFGGPALILFDSFDGFVHDEKKTVKAFRYLEYGEFWFNGRYVCTGARNIKSEVNDKETDNVCHICVGRSDDHIRMRLTGFGKESEFIVALPDSTKYAFISLTGEYCELTDIRVEEQGEVTDENIPRIAPKVKYTNRLEGDIPNIQIDGTRTASTGGIPVTDNLKITFRNTTLPSAEFVWDCAYIVLYSSGDSKVGGPDYREYALIKISGETTCDDRYAVNTLDVDKTDEFENWEAWKEQNKKGSDTEIVFSLGRKKIVTDIITNGLKMRNTTKIFDPPREIYAALTGDCCALTGIFITKRN